MLNIFARKLKNQKVDGLCLIIVTITDGLLAASLECWLTAFRNDH